MAETKFTWRETTKKWARPTGARHTFQVTPFKGHILEVEDVHFHHDSAVLLPDYGAASAGDHLPAAADDPDRITGIGILLACYRHAKKNPAQKIIINGHTDTTGAPAYNLTLSQQRADNVHAALAGDRAGWVAICHQKHKVEDYQLILKWVKETKGWDCDPGAVDNVSGPKTSGALKSFQKTYNVKFNASIAEDGHIGQQTWGAFFDVYMDVLKSSLKPADGDLDSLRAGMKFLDGGRKTVGCGENFPIEAARFDNYRSEINRRVEILFFDPGEEPKLDCHPARGQCKPLQCEIYNSRLYRFIHIKPEPVTLKLLDITKVDDHFAPSKELLDVYYKIKGFSADVVKVEISSAHYANNPIFTRELTAEEKADGRHHLQWDGKANCKDGDLKERFINPLYAPYKVRIFYDDVYTDHEPFKVLYHSVEIKKGPWTPDEKEPPEADEKPWVQYKLNELGYYGGPVGKDTESYLKKAVIRYKANHKNLHQLDYTKYSDAIAIGLKAALKNNENPRPFLDEAAFSDKSKRSKILVEAITYEEGEFNTSNATHEAERLNRPLIPVEAEIYLKSKEPANDKTLAPEAVGAVRVNWRFKDPDEDTSTQLESVAGEPSLTKKYVEKCLKLKSGRSGTNGDNSHKDFKGIREAPDANWPTAFLLGDFYIPHVVEKDAGQKVVFSKACVDAAKFPKRVGRAGVYFRPSYVAGDDYQLKAELDFTGLPNKDDLEKFHEVKDEKSRIHVETGTFFISRFNQVAMVVNWPARTNADEWDKVAAEFLKAHMDVDVGQIASKKMSEVLTKAEYQKIVKDNTTHSDLSKINLEDDSLVGVALPAQGALDAAAYKTTLRTFVHADYGRKIRDDLRKKLSENIRKEHPNGFVIVNFLSHKPVDIKNAPPGDNTVTAANTAFITWSSSVGMADSIILADQKDPDKVYYVVAHEMGHNFWLHHWEHVDVPSPKEHDQKDHNCLMSYSSSACAHPHHVPGTYTPHFCGKCNLKLRGWDIDHADMLDDSD